MKAASSSSSESIRLFQNEVLEAMTHVHPAVPIVVYVPVILFFLVRGLLATAILPGTGVFLLGFLLWTLTEYWIHRGLFHFEFRSDFGRRIHFLFHGIHHDTPRDGTRLVMPLAVSAPLASFFYVAFGPVFGAYRDVAFSGFMAGYLAYDCLHYATHHFAMKNPIAKRIKAHHLRHHYADGDTGFGVSSPLWDHVFGTL